MAILASLCLSQKKHINAIGFIVFIDSVCGNVHVACAGAYKAIKKTRDPRLYLLYSFDSDCGIVHVAFAGADGLVNYGKAIRLIRPLSYHLFRTVFAAFVHVAFAL